MLQWRRSSRLFQPTRPRRPPQPGAPQPATSAAPGKDGELSFEADAAGKTTIDSTVGSETERVEPIESLTKKPRTFRSTIKSLLTQDRACAAANVSEVLNKQVINFVSANAQMPSAAVENLHKLAQMLLVCADNRKPTKLEVAGYSDNPGDAQANLQLVKERAESVRAYLIRAGAPANSLTAEGYGDIRPVASSDTESSRFANRRIEFVAAQR